MSTTLTLSKEELMERARVQMREHLPSTSIIREKPYQYYKII